MWIKRVLKGTLLTVVIGGIGLAGWQGYQYWNAEQMDASLNEPETIVWQGNRPMPPTVDPGAYLTAMHASFRDDLQTAADSYLKVYNGDPKSPQAQREAYFFNALLGRFDQLKPVVREISEEYRFALFTDYVQAAYALKQENWAAARQVLEDAKDLPLGEVMKPLLLAWTYVGENDYSAAMKALEPLKQNPELSPYYDYHRGLMALAMKQEFAADDAFQALAEKDLPIFSLYPEVIAFYISRGQWTVANPFYVQWKAFVAQQPATGELITATTSKPLTAKRGVAEVFYNMSTAMGSSQSSYEGALVLSALSLYLNTKQDLPKIWSAEILEQVKKPHLAAYYYNQLNYAETQTIAFKKAMNLMACGRESEAKPILIRLKSTNKNSVQLWWALADVYQNEKNWPAAVQCYTHILDIEGESNRKLASNTYFARAFVYGAQKNKYKEEQDLQRAMELNPENPMILNHLGYQWLENDQTLDKGFDLVQKAYKLRSSDPHIIDSMAYGYYRKADYQKALPLAEKTVDIMPQSSVANVHLGDIYEALGRHREAIFQYKKALALKYDLTPELKQEILSKISLQKKVLSKQNHKYLVEK